MESNPARSDRSGGRRRQPPAQRPLKEHNGARCNKYYKMRESVPERLDDVSCMSDDDRALEAPQSAKYDASASHGPSRVNDVDRDYDVLTLAKRQPTNKNPIRVYLASLGVGSRHTMMEALKIVARVLSNGRAGPLDIDWSQIRFQHTAAVRSLLMAKYKPQSTNKMLSGLRGVLKAAWRLGQMDAETYFRTVDIPAVRGSSLLAGRALESGEISALFGTCDDRTKSGLRDAALIGTLYGCGLRRSETVGLDLADFDPANGSLTIRKAKGNKQRMVYLPKGALEAVRDWVSIRGPEAGALFCPVDRVDRITVRRLSSIAVWNMAQKRAREACVDRFSVHDLRRTFISDLLDAGADIVSIQGLAGHANINTTARYDRRGETTKKSAAQKLFVPYVSRLPKVAITESDIEKEEKG
jgi:site-specific recombinase XerD